MPLKLGILNVHLKKPRPETGQFEPLLEDTTWTWLFWTFIRSHVQETGHFERLLEEGMSLKLAILNLY